MGNSHARLRPDHTPHDPGSWGLDMHALIGGLRTDPRTPMTDRPFPRQLILGHRGSPRIALENTLRSFAVAVEMGADGVELDVQRTSDGVPAVIHDDTLDRTMGVRGDVARLAWPAIARLTAARVPTLQQATAWAAASGAWLNIEIKAFELEEAVVREIAAAGIGERVIVSSFEPSIVGRLGEVDGSIRRFLLTKRWNDRAIQAARESRAEGVCLRVDSAVEPVLEDLRTRGLPVIVWTVNDATEIRRLLDAGVVGVISDDPGLAARVRDQLSP